MTKELLLARKAELEAAIANQRATRASLTAEIGRLQAQHQHAFNMENTLGGAKQECENWLAKLPAEDPKSDKVPDPAKEAVQ